MFFCYDYFQFSSGSKVPSNNIPFFQYCILFIKIKNLNSYFKKLIFEKLKVKNERFREKKNRKYIEKIQKN